MFRRQREEKKEYLLPFPSLSFDALGFFFSNSLLE